MKQYTIKQDGKDAFTMSVIDSVVSLTCQPMELSKTTLERIYKAIQQSDTITFFLIRNGISAKKLLKALQEVNNEVSFYGEGDDDWEILSELNLL